MTVIRLELPSAVVVEYPQVIRVRKKHSSVYWKLIFGRFYHKYKYAEWCVNTSSELVSAIRDKFLARGEQLLIVLQDTLTRFRGYVRASTDPEELLMWHCVFFGVLLSHPEPHGLICKKTQGLQRRGNEGTWEPRRIVPGVWTWAPTALSVVLAPQRLFVQLWRLQRRIHYLLLDGGD